MGRRATQATLTERWLRSNRDWLDPSHPLVGQLRMLATTMDADMAEKGRIVPSAAAAYQKALDKLEAGRPADPPGGASSSGVEPTGGRPGDAGLFGPAVVE